MASALWRVWLAKWCKIHKVYMHSHSVFLSTYTNVFIHIQKPNLHSRNIFIRVYLPSVASDFSNNVKPKNTKRVVVVIVDYTYCIILLTEYENNTLICTEISTNLLPKQVECFFGDARNSCRWQESRMFWVTWQNAREHIPLCRLAQFFRRASSESSQSSNFGFCC